MHLLTEQNAAEYPIQPYHIDVETHFFDAFGHMETEVSARWIVEFFKAKGITWRPFTFEEINKFYREEGRNSDFYFNQLIEKKFILKKDNLFQVSHEFICRCFASAPNLVEIATLRPTS